jgi:hypothetical protein
MIRQASASLYFAHGRSLRSVKARGIYGKLDGKVAAITGAGGGIDARRRRQWLRVSLIVANDLA